MLEAKLLLWTVIWINSVPSITIYSLRGKCFSSSSCWNPYLLDVSCLSQRSRKERTSGDRRIWIAEILHWAHRESTESSNSKPLATGEVAIRWWSEAMQWDILGIWLDHLSRSMLPRFRQKRDNPWSWLQCRRRWGKLKHQGPGPSHGTSTPLTSAVNSYRHLP